MAKYDENQTARIVDTYSAAVEDNADYEARSQVVANLAEEYGSKPASIRQVLVRAGVYIPKERTKKGAGVTKETLVENIAKRLGVAADMLPGLEKANKTTLNRLKKALPLPDSE